MLGSLNRDLWILVSLDGFYASEFVEFESSRFSDPNCVGSNYTITSSTNLSSYQVTILSQCINRHRERIRFIVSLTILRRFLIRRFTRFVTELVINNSYESLLLY